LQALRELTIMLSAFYESSETMLDSQESAITAKPSL
jgi:hypothetical protein